MIPKYTNLSLFFLKVALYVIKLLVQGFGLKEATEEAAREFDCSINEVKKAYEKYK